LESLFLQGPAGRLDARLHGPAAGRPVLLLHPHPLFGGTMGSRLVYDLAAGLGAAGFRALRFDFRGVGRSEGRYAHGVGEAADARAAWDHLRAATGQAPAVVGYSFGGAVACRLAAEAAVPTLVGVAAPVDVMESRLAPLDDARRCTAGRVHLVAGEGDPLVPFEDARRLAAAFPRPASLSLIPGGGHFLEPARNPEVLADVLPVLG
jgi:alpha/beta superfamily hydrolase